jgi:hypothetical protein
MQEGCDQIFAGREGFARPVIEGCKSEWSMEKKKAANVLQLTRSF